MKRYKPRPEYKQRRLERETEVYIQRAVDQLALLMDAASMDAIHEEWAAANLGFTAQFKPLAH